MTTGELRVWRASTPLVLLSLVTAVLIYLTFADGLERMVNIWDKKEEYGHGYMIPLIILFLIWQRKDKLERIEFNGSWAGVAVGALGLVFFTLGELAAHYAIIQYSFMIVVIGTVLAALGKRAFMLILIPVFMMFFMIPLPNFLFSRLSAALQLISSELGVFVIRLFDISVYLEGNVIDLGVYKLQVVEACSGLNYLFPLMTLGFMVAYFFTGAFWKKAVIFLSTIPITVLMNSFRIGVIGVTVEYWGVEMAEGFLHDFEGWAVFMSCIGILVLEMWVLSQIGKDRMPLHQAFGLDFPEETPKDAVVERRRLEPQLVVMAVLVAATLVASIIIPDREEVVPERKALALFPLDIEDWRGSRTRLENNILEALDLSDYIVAGYRNSSGEVVNFYTAFYESQRKGESIHSPKACIPGGGWVITSITEHTIDRFSTREQPFTVRRLVIRKGDIKQLVYYWFQQRGRVLSHEYQLKLYLLYDSLTMGRTDGALVRLTTTLEPGQDIGIADERLQRFLDDVLPLVPQYVPD